MPAGFRTSPAHVMIAIATIAPTGKPKYTFVRLTTKSPRVQRSSTAPEEKKSKG